MAGGQSVRMYMCVCPHAEVTNYLLRHWPDIDPIPVSILSLYLSSLRM